MDITPSLWYQENLDKYPVLGAPREQPKQVRDYTEANLVGSRCGTADRHDILLDLDGEHIYRPSSTRGHGHLLVKAGVNWYQYRKLLEALRDCRVIEAGFYDAAVKREQTFLRLPHIKKGAKGNPIQELLNICSAP